MNGAKCLPRRVLFETLAVPQIVKNFSVFDATY
jgi:hypothetical protein